MSIHNRGKQALEQNVKETEVAGPYEGAYPPCAQFELQVTVANISYNVAIAEEKDGDCDDCGKKNHAFRRARQTSKVPRYASPEHLYQAYWRTDYSHDCAKHRGNK